MSESITANVTVTITAIIIKFHYITGLCTEPKKITHWKHCSYRYLKPVIANQV